MSDDARSEHDLLGEVAVPAGSLHGAHTERALENFPLAGRPVHVELARAFGVVKLACARTNRALGAWEGQEARPRPTPSSAPVASWPTGSSTSTSSPTACRAAPVRAST